LRSIQGGPVAVDPRALTVLLVAAALGPPLAFGQEAPADSADPDHLARQLSNPVAALISVPLQLNWDTGYGTDGNGERFTFNIQPVAPFHLTENWNVISRTILPLIHRTDVLGNGSDTGTGDTTPSLFFSPKQPTANGWIWGVGPACLLPTASEDVLGTGKWAIGPTAVVLKQTATGWTYGALTNYLVSVAGDDDRADAESLFLQPFLSKTLGRGRTVTVNVESSYDIEGDQWLVPLNATYTKIAKIGGQMLSFGGAARVYLDSPTGGPDWGLRFIVTLLYPK
jgi:Putative MetA-pathway of phenol degradation